MHAALVPVLDAELQAAHGLPITWYDVLLELNAAPGRRMTMGELGAAAVVSRSRVSRVVDDLVAAGLVARAANPDDRRSAYAVIYRRRSPAAARGRAHLPRRHRTALHLPDDRRRGAHGRDRAGEGAERCCLI